MKMRRKGVKKDSNERMFLSVFTFLIIFLLGLILPRSTNAVNEEKSQNYFYIKAISNTLVSINSKSSGQQDINSEIKYSVLSFLGIDTSNPISIISKEVSYFRGNKIIANANANANNDSNDIENIETVTPFELGEKQITKIEDPNAVAKNLKQTLNKLAPRVLIYHSHTTEAYRTSDPSTSKTNFDTDETRNVCAVGDVIKEELEKKYGISVIHDKTLHNIQDYDESYKKSGVTLDKYLKAYGGFDIIIDLHRDGFAASNRRVSKTKINGEDVAKYMFVVTDKNPHYQKQKELIDSIMKISNKLYPGLMEDRTITFNHYGLGFYNQNRSDNAMLIEVGSNNNTIDEVKNTGKYLARIFAEQLNGKSD
ncbi:MAG: stage II sporulation protein P [Clostridium sp.]|jgi:stage II sporulation protein P